MTPFQGIALLTTWALLFSFVVGQCDNQGGICTAGWFGPNCQYKCRCVSDRCDSSGKCTDGVKCERGWFGPSCQYDDLSTLKNPSTSDRVTFKPSWTDRYLTDDNHDTCISGPLSNVSVTRTPAFHFTWLRIQVREPESLQKVEIKFQQSFNSGQIDCSNKKTSIINNKTLDIHCQLSTVIEEVILTGEGVSSLCSLYISGGRNVALKQNATQIGTYSDVLRYGSCRAVDGNSDGNNAGRWSCSHTTVGKSPRKWWQIHLSRPQLVNRYVIHNRDDGIDNKNALSGFTLQSLTDSGDEVFTYIDSSTTAQDEYRVIPNQAEQISTVKITTATNLLSLCEVEVYGDSVCPGLMYGRECEHTCNCDKSGEQCFYSTGGCPSGCAAGFHGEGCTKGTCPIGFHGSSCEKTCPEHCFEGVCDKTSGFCSSCQPGWQGLNCDGECSSGRYGKDCLEYCAFHCFRGTCDGVTGACDDGCAQGYEPPNCIEECPDGFHGFNCTESCSVTCVNQSCDHVSGKCTYGCLPGYLGDTCDQECPATFYGVDCLDKCDNSCVNTLCNRVNGVCDDCPPGKTGDFCTEDCPDGKFGGGRCSQNCSANCEESLCNNVNGICLQGCVDGYSGPKCEQECPDKTFGEDCRFNCSQNCMINETNDGSVCHHVSGHCLLGCKNGYDGPACSKALTSDDINAGVIAGPVIAIILLVIAVALGLFVWRKQRNGKPKNLLDNASRMEATESGFAGPQTVRAKNADEKPERNSNGIQPPKATGAPSEETYYNMQAGQQNTAIAVDDLNNFMLSHSRAFFDEQFKKIPTNNVAPMTVGMSSENKSKNRYKNIVTYDHSRVCLQVNADKKHGDYINASYTAGYNNEETFIASQGPNKLILDDFVRMLWEQKVDKVVMLTNLIEEGKGKCDRYWPEDSEAEFGEIRVRLAATQVFADYTIRKLLLQKVGQGSHNLTQFHFTSWPDKGVPTSPWGLVDFEQRVASLPTTRPIVVHCSAGVGRTGTFIALRNVMREAEVTGQMDFFTTLWKLRQDRVFMIQTLDQYLFLHEAAQVAMVCLGTTVTSVGIAERINKLEMAPSGSSQTYMEQEFKAICNVSVDTQEIDDEEGSGGSNSAVYQNSRTVSNKQKNRFSNILPKNSHRPFLSCESKDMENYINAVLVPSFIKKDKNILTQLPLPTTVNDFWRLVTQYKVSLIVAFEVDSKDTDSTIGDYLPPSEIEATHSGSFDIESGSISHGSNWEEQTLTVTIHKKRKTRLSTSSSATEERQVTHLKCSDIDLSPSKLLSFVQHARTLSPSKEGRTLYTCRNGADYSGLVCVLSLLLDRMDNDHCLTIPLVVGAIKAIRSQVIPTLAQYKLLYQILKLHNESIDTGIYNNMQSLQPNAVSNMGIANPVFDATEQDDVNVYENK